MKGSFVIKVSVIVPVYNVEKFLNKCLESIVNQSLEDIEIILINDGSKDSSHTICKEYAKKYFKKIKYINNTNRGCSATRNLGIDIAKGEYITFVDSDDYIEKELCLKLYNKAKEKEYDMIISGMNYISIDKMYIPDSNLTKKEILSYKNKVGFVCGRLYKRNFLKANNIIFPEHLHCAEDLFFSFISIIKSKKIGVVREALYNYVYHGNNSIFDLDKKRDMFVVFEKLYKYLDENNYLMDNSIRNSYLEIFNFYAIRGVFFILLKSSKEEYKKYDKLFYNDLKKMKFLPLRSRVLIYYYRSIIWIIQKFKLYKVLKKLKNRVKK